MSHSTEPTPNAMTNLGYLNSWHETPMIVVTCEHDPVPDRLGNCVREYRCDVCGYFYRVDSSD